MDEELAQTIQQAMDGNKTAFAIVCRYKNHIVNIAFGILDNAHDAEDVAQEAFLKAYMSIRNLKNAHAFYRWLVKITTNLSIDRKNKSSRYMQQAESFESLIDLKHQHHGGHAAGRRIWEWEGDFMNRVTLLTLIVAICVSIFFAPSGKGFSYYYFHD